MSVQTKPQSKKELPDKLLRLRQVLNVIPVSKSSWWAGVKSGKYPEPIKLGPKTTVWKNSAIQKIVSNGVE